jgi:hypothetical protein
LHRDKSQGGGRSVTTASRSLLSSEDDDYDLDSDFDHIKAFLKRKHLLWVVSDDLPGSLPGFFTLLRYLQ